MASSNEEIVRRFGDVLNRSTSVDAVMAELEPFMDPEIEYVNPADAVERGTRNGVAGMRTVFENFVEGAGAEVTVELEELEERGERISLKVACTLGAVRVAPRPRVRPSPRSTPFATDESE